MPTIHEGKNIKRIRSWQGIKQEAIASHLGISQQSVSLLEERETIDPLTLAKIAEVLKVPVEVIKNLNEDQAYNIFGNTVTNNDNVAFVQHNHNPSFNPIDKVVDLYDKIIAEQKEEIERLRATVAEQGAEIQKLRQGVKSK